MSKGPKKSIIASFGALASANPDPQPTRKSEPMPRVGAGVIGATQRSLSDIREERDRLQKQIEEGGGFLLLDPALIDPSPVPDRLPDDTDDDFQAFKETINTEGQKIPIQVRRNPDNESRYQVVYGHRRWRAAQELGTTVKAIIGEYSDRDLVVAQGIENGNRQDLSWIEKALYAWRMESTGIKARDIKAALSVDDSELSKFRSVCRVVTIPYIEAIGRAPKIGRPRWLELVSLIEATAGSEVTIAETLAAAKVSEKSSDDRFAAILMSLQPTKKRSDSEVKTLSADDKALGRMEFKANQIRIVLAKEHAKPFARFMETEMPALVERYLSDGGHEDP